ncbi:MAG: FMN-binding protein [Deltaproteobacteria bacterium]|nr:FMN-binding protein [Deltaproteobacteria bacterium]
MRRALALGAALGVVTASAVAVAKVFKLPDDAIQEHLGESVEVRNVVLTDDQVRDVEKASHAKVDSKLVSFYVGRANGNIKGYAFVDTHVVRTKPEAVLFVLTPSGDIDNIIVLSFREPLEFMPTERWMGLFKGRSLAKQSLRLRQEIPNISGATLTARAVVESARKVLALWQTLFKK